MYLDFTQTTQSSSPKTKPFPSNSSHHKALNEFLTLLNKIGLQQSLSKIIENQRP